MWATGNATPHVDMQMQIPSGGGGATEPTVRRDHHTHHGRRHRRPQCTPVQLWLGIVHTTCLRAWLWLSAYRGAERLCIGGGGCCAHALALYKPPQNKSPVGGLRKRGQGQRASARPASSPEQPNNAPHPLYIYAVFLMQRAASDPPSNPPLSRCGLRPCKNNNKRKEEEEARSHKQSASR
jgi:hypothetical protein